MSFHALRVPASTMLWDWGRCRWDTPLYSMPGLGLSFTSDIGHFGFSHHHVPSPVMMRLDIFALTFYICLSETKSHVSMKASLDVKSSFQFF